MNEPNYRGILCIGDPHLCAWAPGYRKDDYPQIVLEKLQWALEYARRNDLLAVLLGDLFEKPRDNSNWLLARLMVMLDRPVLAVIGNHDLSENLLCDHDSLKVLLAAGRLRLLNENPWRGTINDVPVLIGGTNYGQPLPRVLDMQTKGEARLVFWITHHDIQFPTYEAGHLDCREIPGVNLVINGHIHRQMNDVVNGQTTWCNPGNITRVKRSDMSKTHVPGVLRIDLSDAGFTRQRIDVPHQAYENAFHPMDPDEALPEAGASSFISGLAAMQKFRTADGTGLRLLIEERLPEIEDGRVKTEILSLMNEVLSHA